MVPNALGLLSLLCSLTLLFGGTKRFMALKPFVFVATLFVVRTGFEPIWLFLFTYTPFWCGETLSWLIGLSLLFSLLFGDVEGLRLL